MDASAAAKEAVKQAQELLGCTTCGERQAIEVFMDEMDAFMEGLRMRLEELEDEEETDEDA